MQDLLNFVHEWCRKWRLVIIFSETNATHFRNKGKAHSNYGDQILQYTSVYMYLGVHLNEHLDFAVTAEILTKAGGKALGAVISKIHSYKDVGYTCNTYSQLFNSCVVPVLDYCSGVWSFKYNEKSDMIQNRAIRYFIGVHRFASILAITGDMEWIVSSDRHCVNILRLWNRLVNMQESRLTRKVFEYDYCFSSDKN